MKLRTFSNSFNKLIEDITNIDCNALSDATLYEKVATLMFAHIRWLRTNDAIKGKERRLLTNEVALIYSFVFLNPNKNGNIIYNLFIKLKTKEIIKDIALLKCCISNGLVLFSTEELNSLVSQA